MVPSTLLGLVLLAASIGPGYVWVWVAETRVPRSRRTQLLEVAELIFIGGLASTLAFLLTFSFASWVSWIDTDALATDGTTYVLRHPARGLGIVFLGLVLAYGGAYAAARFRYRGRPPIIGHGYSAWHRVLGPKAGQSVYATVDLRDGTTVVGWVYSSTVDDVPTTERELGLAAFPGAPLKMRPPNSETFFDSQDRAVILSGADVLSVTASYYPDPPALTQARGTKSARRFGWLRRAWPLKPG